MRLHLNTYVLWLNIQNIRIVYVQHILFLFNTGAWRPTGLPSDITVNAFPVHFILKGSQVGIVRPNQLHAENIISMTLTITQSILLNVCLERSLHSHL